MTGESCCGSPTSISDAPRRMGTSDMAVLHWLASSMMTMSKLGSGSPRRWAEMQVVATMGKTRSSFFRFSGSERYLLNCVTRSLSVSGLWTMLIKSLYFGSSNRRMQRAEV